MPVQVIIIVVLVTVIGLLGYAIIKSLMSPRKVEGIEKLLAGGKVSAAIRLAKTVISKDPDDYHARYFLGKAYLQDNKPELALMEFKAVNQKALFDTTLPEIPFRKTFAQLLQKYNQQEDALKEYLLLTKLEPSNAENFFMAGKLLDERNKSDQSIHFYQQAIKLDKRHIKAHASLGLLLYNRKQLSEAKKEIEYALTLSPNTFSTYYFLGKILKEGKDYAGAVAAFEKSLRDAEYKQRSLLERGTCYMAANSYDKAIIELERAVKMGGEDSAPEMLHARYFLAACYEKTRKIDLAIAEWSKIYAKNRTFRDVAAKLTEYQNFHTNDNMKEYLTSSSEDFMEMCKVIAQKGLNKSPKDCQQTKFGCRILATEISKDNWMRSREALFLLLFFRENDIIEEALLRSLLEEMKKQNIDSAVICTNSGFSRSALQFAESRPLELIDKEKLEEILAKSF